MADEQEPKQNLNQDLQKEQAASDMQKYAEGLKNQCRLRRTIQRSRKFLKEKL